MQNLASTMQNQFSPASRKGARKCERVAFFGYRFRLELPTLIGINHTFRQINGDPGMSGNRPELGFQPQEFAQMMQRVADGSQEAARELFQRYGPHIRRVVRRRLDPRLRPKFDSIDFVQEVWTSFFAHELQKDRFERPENLMRLLVTMTYHKVTDAFRKRLQSQQYDVNREHSLDSSTVTRNGDLISGEPSPAQVAETEEEWRRLLQRFPERSQLILNMLRHGYDPTEIAKRLVVNPKTVRRLIEELGGRHQR
jgi:RNA polymerase sigma-70 factor (ECF subfamily)